MKTGGAAVVKDAFTAGFAVKASFTTTGPLSCGQERPRARTAIMGIRSAFSDLFGLRCPVASAPMAGVAGGALAAAVSSSGGLGLVGGGYATDLDWLAHQLDTVIGRIGATSATGTANATDTEVSPTTAPPWGVGLITWKASRAALDLVLTYQPDAVMLSFGTPDRFAAAVKESGARLICQVTTLAEALQALEAEADVIVAQGTEAGGHGGSRSTLPLVSAVVEAAPNTPVLAAGGIVDGRGLAAALMLGAQGALIGTRMQATHESLAPPGIKARLTEATGDDTVRTRLFDVVRGLDWPAGYTGRSVENQFLRQWRGHGDALAGDRAQRQAFQAAQDRGDPENAIVWAGEGVDLITDVRSAGDVVTEIAGQAEQLLRSAPQRWLG